MTSHLVMLLLATGFFYNYTPSLSKTSLQEATTNADSKKDAKQHQAKADAIPKWLKKVVHELEAARRDNTTARIIRYRYRNEFVYFLESKCCDMFNNLYDINGKRICSTGGVHGRGDGKCADFYSERKDEKVIWEDKRKRN
jgi:hypothetical protein